VPHPFRVFLRNGWETCKILVYTFPEDALSALDPVSAVLFGSIERLVGQVKQFIALFHRNGRSGIDSNAQSDCNLIVACVDRLLRHRQADALGHFENRMGFAPWDKDKELLATIASHEVVGAKRGLHPPCDLSQRNVATDVAELIVDDLEMIDIGNEHSDGRLFPGSFGALA
jgi:hypothetical protein